MKRVIFWDTETIRLSDEISGGWSNIPGMGLAVASVFDSSTKTFTSYYEKDVQDLIKHLQSADLIVSYNGENFDFPLLTAYTDFNFKTLPSFDIMRLVNEQLGHRLKLQNLVQATLGKSKSGEGTESVSWWRSGQIERVTQYCCQDVALTRDLFLFGLRNDYLIYKNKFGCAIRIPFKHNLDSSEFLSTGV